MVSFILLQAALLFTLLVSFASAAPAVKDGCEGFHVTSPTTYFTTTAGQCQEVSYDFGASAPAKPSTIKIDLYEYKTDKFINTLVKNVAATGIVSPWFNIDLGSYQKTGDYYFLVTYGASCKPIKTSYFHVLYNKNSPPAVCPK
ncbi:uncharacterized protein EV154DRAFT_2440 [Mucor mucedo]|uniref:Secreted protein n=1 Tax=Mucor saturninus TaxID=64648 RepID=A0A8H7RPN9_9FUNG|nr:uncharacterized protein EV154DRAFT_2440 [Mucor mucedo]KAG2214365.1 hypothetical protein INT47_000921 [Mucor saturninus]KAI7897256.1 hypothetical protein EV154DRAFT_2440 [Mucor mucedo]